MSKRKKIKDPFYKREAQKYDTPIPSREYIADHLTKLGHAVTREQLEADLGITDEERAEALRRRLIAMLRDGQIIRNRRGALALVAQLELIKGKVLGHKDGFGFLERDDGGDDVYLSPGQMRRVFPGDMVLIRLIEGRRGRSEGVIVEILKRNTEKIVGRYIEEQHVAVVEPDDKAIQQDILIAKADKNNAKHGQFVTVEIIAQPTARRQAAGRVVEVLGDAMTPGMEIELAIRAHGIPHQFKADVKAETAKFPSKVSASEREGRKDLRSLPLVTIDGEDAKDFDDAVYCKSMEDDGWLLLVAIADVSHYVKPQSALDIEAEERGNSVYFPGRVVPMLPHALSNELCSLKPNVDRLAMVCEMRVNSQGELQRYRFFEAVICSHARMTYTEVAQMLKHRTKKHYALYPNIMDLHELYLSLKKQRQKRGSLDFDTTETKIIFGKNQKIKKIVPVERNDAHRMIEECMLLANVCAAKFVAKHRIPALYRNHEVPSPTKLKKLRDFLKGVGLRLSGGDEPSTKDYARLLQRVRNRPDAHMLQTIVLRSLMQANYEPERGEHFGLAYDYYAHFTSPIRRYPDLLLHRAIRHLLQRRSKKDYPYSTDQMQHYGQHCSMTERRADMATMEATDWLKCYFMQNKLGKEYDGIISGVTSFGVFVELKDIYVEGLVHITALKNDYYQFIENQHSLIGKRTGIKYQLGDPIKVLVARVDLAEREIDFDVV